MRLFLLSMTVLVRIGALPVFLVHELIHIFFNYLATLKSLPVTKMVVYEYNIEIFLTLIRQGGAGIHPPPRCFAQYFRNATCYCSRRDIS